jgi:glutathione synthase
MTKIKVAFFIDQIEFKYFAFNRLVTSFWLIKECLERGFDVQISTANQLYLEGNKPKALMHKSYIKEKGDSIDIAYHKNAKYCELNQYDIVFFRPDPPVTIEYIYSTYILDYLDRNKILVINDPTGIRNANEKLYINEFPEYIPANVTTSQAGIIKDFLNQYEEIVIKPLNKCFGKGVFYIKKGDKNINSIIEAATNAGKTVVMVQQFLKSDEFGDKRVNIICGNILEQGIIKMAGEEDFKFNAQQDKYFKRGDLTPREKQICQTIAPKLIHDGLYLVGLDIIADQIIEINVTSPCFFIKEINNLYNVTLEKSIINHVEELYTSRKSNLKLVS